MLLVDIPFTRCIERSSGRCSCYLEVLDGCFAQQGSGQMLDVAYLGERNFRPITYNQSKCMPEWKRAAYRVINDEGDGKLNCKSCRLEPLQLLNSLPTLIDQFLDLNRKDAGPIYIYIYIYIYIMLNQNRNIDLKSKLSSRKDSESFSFSKDPPS
jgi:callose synthase